MNTALPILAGEALIELLAARGGAARAGGGVDDLPTVTLGLADAAEVQGRVLGLSDAGKPTRWLVLIDGAELHHVRLDRITRLSLSTEAARQVAAIPPPSTVPTRLALVRRAAGIAAAVRAEVASPFAIEIMFERFPEDDAALTALDKVLDALAEALRRLTMAPLGIEAISGHIRGVLIHPVAGGAAGLRLDDDRLILELRLDGAVIAPVDPGALTRDIEAVLP